jgi:phage tail-like protein
MISQQRALVRMPDVVGLPLTKAKLLISNAGLLVDGLVFQESYEPRDQVLTQKPVRGQMVYTGEKVVLGVSRESFIKWLPSIYQRTDINGRNFVRELLWVIQHLFSSVEETLDVIHNFFDPYEAPEKFLPWLASWSAMILDEDWPLSKKRRLIRKAIELYRIRGTVKGTKLFLSMFTGHEPIIRENEWPFKGWRIGVSSGIGIDTVVLPPVNLAHAFIVEMPVSYKDLSTEAIIRIHEILLMEKPANAQYYLRFAAESGPTKLQEFFTIGRGSIGVGVTEADMITSEEALEKALAAQPKDTGLAVKKPAGAGAPVEEETDEAFKPQPRKKPLKKAPRADTAPVEGQERDPTSHKTMMATAVTEQMSKKTVLGDPSSGKTIMATSDASSGKTIMAEARTMAIDAVTDEQAKKRRRDEDDDKKGPKKR